MNKKLTINSYSIGAGWLLLSSSVRLLLCWWLLLRWLRFLLIQRLNQHCQGQITAPSLMLSLSNWRPSLR